MLFFLKKPWWLFLLWVCIPPSIFAQDTATHSPITFTTHDFFFRGPANISGGWQTIRLVNEGRDYHQIQFLQLPSGKTFADFQASLRADPARGIPHWIHRRGGVNSVAPGAQAVAVVNLVPGDYVIVCGIPGRRGQPHFVQGMMGSLQVKPSPISPTTPPSADVTITAVDFSYALEGNLTPGSRTINFKNEGTQAHEVVLLKLQPWASTQYWLNAYLPGGAPNPTGETIGGVVGLDPGLDNYVQVDLKPGRYGLLCFLRDPLTGGPHFTRGMWMDFEVKPLKEPGP